MLRLQIRALSPISHLCVIILCAYVVYIIIIYANRVYRSRIHINVVMILYVLHIKRRARPRDTIDQSRTRFSTAAAADVRPPREFDRPDRPIRV